MVVHFDILTHKIYSLPTRFRGYDTITKSNEYDDEDNGESTEEHVVPHHEASSSPTHEDEDDLLSTSDALMNELIHFYQPYNERLFQLIRKRCPWTGA